MTQKKFENIIFKSFLHLDPIYLSELDNAVNYYFLTKSELIVEISYQFNYFKSKGVTSLIPRPIRCQYCFPDAKAYEFINPKNNLIIERYVINKENNGSYTFHLCGNSLPEVGTEIPPF